jgi:hypothetical protein
MVDDWTTRADRRVSAFGEIAEIDTKVTVTFHYHKFFQNLYKLCDITDFQSFYQSLSPKFNRDMIFKAGEGAGRSGSFFFFSHD